MKTRKLKCHKCLIVVYLEKKNELNAEYACPECLYYMEYVDEVSVEEKEVERNAKRK